MAILLEEISRERFDWLSRMAGEVIATPGSESNVKEIFAKYWELKKTRQDIFIFNQFEEFGNHLWHYEVTGHAIEEVLLKKMFPDHRSELSYEDKRRIHHLKYFIWVEQQGKTLSELKAHRYDAPGYWDRIHGQVDKMDDFIDQFNERTGLQDKKG